MKSKALIFIGILLLVTGILLKKLAQMDLLGLSLIITGVIFKAIYILNKVKSGEYVLGKELVFLFLGLIIFLTGLYLRGLNQTPIYPIFMIVFGILLKTTFIIKFIQNVRK